MSKSNKSDIIKWVALIIVTVSLFYTALVLELGRTKTIEDYKRDMSSQSTILEI